MAYAYRALAAALAAGLVFAAAAHAQKRYGPGASDTEIKFGQTMPYSGPASAYGTIGKAEAAYFRMINDQGGVNGRKLNLISLDDGYSPPRTVEQIRKLVEDEQVLFAFQTLGTPSNTAIHKYMNGRKVPQLFVATGATKWGDPQHYPWTMGWQPTYQHESQIYAKYLLKNRPNAKIAVLFQNDDYGKDYLKGFKDGLGDQVSKLIVAEASYEVTDPTVDSQIVALKASGADVLFNITTPKFAAQAIRKVHDIGWRPLHFLNVVSTSVAAVLQPAGLDKSVGLVSVAYFKDPTDPAWKDDKAVQDYLAFMKKYYPDGNPADAFNVYGLAVAQTLVQTLRQCGDDLTRENLMRQAANLKDVEVPMLLPGIRINTSPTDFYPIEQVQLIRFDGKTWVRFGEIVSR
ncbi:MAG TPA: ABC transporter substrate-binding protein [Burkholderiales bacterium]|nr:ABC transporter substrate-binding protein [Burkholderiales bacterium]